MCTTSIEFSERLFAEIAQTLVKSSRLMNFGGACETLLIQVQRDSVSVGCWCCYLNSFSFRHGRWPFQSVSQSVRAGHACEQPRTLPPLDPTDREADPPARDASRPAGRRRRGQSRLADLGGFARARAPADLQHLSRGIAGADRSVGQSWELGR